jgi:uncharacterized membrane protein HdeD (DUF308 family)
VIASAISVPMITSPTPIEPAAVSGADTPTYHVPMARDRPRRPLPILESIIVVHGVLAVADGLAVIVSLFTALAYFPLALLVFGLPAGILGVVTRSFRRRHRWMPLIMVGVYGLCLLESTVLGIGHYRTTHSVIGRLLKV